MHFRYFGAASAGELGAQQSLAFLDQFPGAGKLARAMAFDLVLHVFLALVLANL